MATSQTFQAELRSVLMGRGTNYPFVDGGGVDIPTPDIRTNDLERLFAAGDYQGPQYAGPVYVNLTMNVVGTSEATLFANLDTLVTAWIPATSDITFELNLPSYGARTISGRPNRFEVPPITGDMRRTWRIYGVRAQFKAGTPTWT